MPFLMENPSWFLITHSSTKLAFRIWERVTVAIGQRRKKQLSEIDICDLFITPAWDPLRQIRREVTLTPGPVVVRGNMSSRNKKKKKFADYVLYWEPGVPLAVVEAKDNKRPPSHGMQQAIGYADAIVEQAVA